MTSFIELAKKRFSTRAFSDKPVEQEKLDLIIEAGRVAPTACNNQPQKVYIVKSEAKRAALAKVCPCTYNAPVVLAVGYDVTRAAKGKVTQGDYDFGETDDAIVTTHMMLEAADLGVDSCYVGWFNSDEVVAALGLPESVRVRALLPIGYKTEDFKPSPMHTKIRDISETVEEL